jgi:predicted phage-related endonuclease
VTADITFGPVPGDRITFEAARVGGVPYLTTAVPVIGWDDGDDTAWLDARRQGIGASEIASVCGVPGAFSSPYALYWAKVLGWDTERTFGMRVGQVLEEPISVLFAEDHPELTIVRPAARLFGHVEHRWMLASPDYIAIATDGPAAWIEPVECKSDEGKSWGDEPPLKHIMQVWQQCMVLGAPRGHLVRLSGKRLTAYIVEPDTDAWRTMIERGEWFTGLRRAGVAPDLDGHDATDDALRRRFPAPVEDVDPAAEVTVRQMVLAEFRAAWEARAAANARFAEARNRVREAMGTARWAVDLDGERVVERRQYKKSGYTVDPATADEIRKAW